MPRFCHLPKRCGVFEIYFEEGEPLRARTVVVASGAYYRRPEIDRLGEFEGRGVGYWASPVEAGLCAGEEVVLVGGGNSAGQAAVYLSGHARKVRMMVRATGLAASMSRYLIDRIAASDVIELMTETEVVGLDGDPEGLRRVTWRDRRSGTETTADIANLFLFCGADPATHWLRACGVALDRHGFVVTGAGTGDATAPALQSTVPGVFAVGDVRAGSVKRVGGAIGEGAQVVAALHRYLGERSSWHDAAMHPRQLYPQGDAECARLRGMPQNSGRMVGASAPVPHLRSRRLLRRLAEQTCDQAFPSHTASHHRGLRSPGRLGLVLCRRSLSRSRR